jgi:hypothetical protein
VPGTVVLDKRDSDSHVSRKKADPGFPVKLKYSQFSSMRVPGRVW